MKVTLGTPKWVKVLLSITLTFVLYSTVGRPAQVASENKYFRDSDSVLYEKYMASRATHPVLAVMYLWAYIKRDPAVYVNNTNGFRDWATKEVQDLVNFIYAPRNDMATVNAHIKSCGCYPCDKCQLKSNSGIGVQQKGLTSLGGVAIPPPDSVVVCVDINFQGQCRVLSIGVYSNATQIGLPNDTISSVMVGSGVRLTLYLHGGLTGKSIAFTSDDATLTDNPIDSSYTWNDNATSLKIERR